MPQGVLKGTRLEFVIVPLEGTVKRKRFTLVPSKQLKRDGTPVRHERKETIVEQPAGYMVYFPRGHCVRLKNKEELARYKLDRDASIISIDGLFDPNSPIGRLITSQDDKARGKAFLSLESKVINAVTANGRRDVLNREAA